MSESEKQKSDEVASPRNKLPRREWLTAFAAGGVVTAGATLGYRSCEVQPRDADAPDLELKYIKSAVEPLREVDFVAEGKRRGLLAEDIQAELATDVNEYLSTTYQAFVYSELVNALPAQLRQGDEVQADIAAMSPVLDQAVADAYYIIGMADEETRKQVDQELRDDPDALMEMASGLDDDGSRRGLGLRGRLRLRRASRQLSARLKMQSADELFAELTDQMTRYSERNAARSEGTDFGVSTSVRRLVAQNQQLALGDPLGARPESGDAGPSEGAQNVQIQYQDPEAAKRVQRLEEKERNLTRASRGLAGAGGALLIAGGIALGVTGGIGGAVAMCIGGFLLLIALFVVAARARRRRQLEEARSGSSGDER